MGRNQNIDYGCRHYGQLRPRDSKNTKFIYFLVSIFDPLYYDKTKEHFVSVLVTILLIHSSVLSKVPLDLLFLNYDLIF
jgi:hypothetical protein